MALIVRPARPAAPCTRLILGGMIESVQSRRATVRQSVVRRAAGCSDGLASRAAAVRDKATVEGQQHA